MRLVFLGIPLAASFLLRDGHEVVLAGYVPTLTLGWRKLERAMGAERLVRSPHKDWDGFRRRVEGEAADLIVSWYFVKKIPPEVLRAARMGAVGAHPSLLPRHRGPDPFFAVIDQGEPVTGVTVHRLEEEYDTGDILAQEPLLVRPWWNAWQLARRLDRVSLSLLRRTLREVEQAGRVVGFAQDERSATSAPAPSDQMLWIDWNRTAEQVERRIRALAPWPGAHTEFSGRRLRLLRARVSSRSLLALVPGQAALVDGRMLVRCGRGAIELLEAEVDGVRWGMVDLANLVARNRLQAW